MIVSKTVIIVLLACGGVLGCIIMGGLQTIYFRLSKQVRLIKSLRWNTNPYRIQIRIGVNSWHEVADFETEKEAQQKYLLYAASQGEWEILAHHK
jgi:hypothetical protein